MLGLQEQQQRNLITAFAVQWKIFTNNGSSGSAMFYLALLATLIGAMLVIFNKKYQSLTVIVPWFIVTAALVFAPYNSQLIFYPLKNTCGEKSSSTICGFTPQVVAAHLGNTLNLIVSDAMSSMPDLVEDARTTLNFERAVDNMQIPPPAKEAIANYLNSKCKGDTQAPGPTTEAAGSNNGSGNTQASGASSNKVAGYTLGELKNQITGFYKGGQKGGGGQNLTSPLIGLYTAKPSGWDNNQWNSYTKNLADLCELCTDTEKDDARKGKNESVAAAARKVVENFRKPNNAPYRSSEAGFHFILVDGSGNPASGEATAEDGPLKIRSEFSKEDNANGRNARLMSPGGSGTSMMDFFKPDSKGQASFTKVSAAVEDNMPVALVNVEPKLDNNGNYTIEAKSGQVSQNCEADRTDAFKKALSRAFPNYKTEVIEALANGGKNNTSVCQTPDKCTVDDICNNKKLECQQDGFTLPFANQLSSEGGVINSSTVEKLQQRLARDGANTQPTTPESQGAFSKAANNAANPAPTNLGFTGDQSSWFGWTLGKVGSFFGKAATIVAGQISGWLAGVFIDVIKTLIELALTVLIIITPFIFLMGVLIPSNAAGMLFYTTVGVVVLKLVPMTMIIIDKIAGVIMATIKASGVGGMEEWTQIGALLWAVSFMYLGSVGLTMFLMFKLGDGGNLMRLTSLDNAAKQISEVGVRATQAIGLAAASVAGGAAMGAWGAAGGAKGLAGAAGGAIDKVQALGQGLANKAGLGQAYSQLSNGMGSFGPEAEGQPGGTPRPGMDPKLDTSAEALSDMVVDKKDGSGDFISMKDYLNANDQYDGTVRAQDGSIMNMSDFIAQEGVTPSGSSTAYHGTAGKPQDFSVVDTLGNDIAGDAQAWGDPKAWEAAGSAMNKPPVVGDDTTGTAGVIAGTAVREIPADGPAATGGSGGPVTGGNIRVEGGRLDSVDRVENLGQGTPAAAATLQGAPEIVDKVEANTINTTGGTGDVDAATAPVAGAIESKPADDTATSDIDRMANAVREGAAKGTAEGISQAPPAMASSSPELESVDKATAQQEWDKLSGWEKLKRGALAGAVGSWDAMGGGLKGIPVVGNMLAEVWNEKDQGSIRAKAMFMAGKQQGQEGSAWGSYSSYKNLKKGGSLAKLWSQEEGVLSTGTAFRETERMGMNMGGLSNAVDSGRQSAARIIAEYEGRRQARDETKVDFSTADYLRKSMLSSIQNSMDLAKSSIVIRDGQFKFEDSSGKALKGLEAMRVVASMNANYSAVGFDSSIQVARKAQILGNEVFKLEGGDQSIRRTTAFTAKLLDSDLSAKERGNYIKAYKDVMDAQEKSAERAETVKTFKEDQVFRSYREVAKKNGAVFKSYRDASEAILDTSWDPREVHFVNGTKSKLQNPESMLGVEFVKSVGNTLVGMKGFANILHVVKKQGNADKLIQLDKANTRSSFNAQVIKQAMDTLSTLPAETQMKDYGIIKRNVMSAEEITLLRQGLQSLTSTSGNQVFKELQKLDGEPATELGNRRPRGNKQ